MSKVPPSKSRTNSVLRLLRNQRTQPLVIAFLSILLSFIVISIIILVIGKSPMTVFKSLVQAAGLWPKPRYAGGRSMLTDFLGLLDAITPMLFASIAVSIAFKAGLFNIGISGQMLASGFLATVLVGYSGLSAVVAKPAVLIIGLLAGATIASLIGLLKAYFNIHEVVSTIMVNYIIQYIVSFCIKRYFVDPVSRQSKAVSEASRLTLVNVPIGDVFARIPLCFFLALATAIAFYIVLNRTKLGFEIRAVGINKKAAEYSGIRSNRTIVITMALSGAAAGLAGVTLYLGYVSSIVPGDLSSIGFDSIAVALLANSNPLACILSSIFISSLDYGMIYMSSTAGISRYIASLLVAIVLLFSACSGFFTSIVNKQGQMLVDEDETEGEAALQATPEEDGR